MKQEDINNKANQLLHEFDALESIDPSGNWEDELFSKLTATRRPNTGKLTQIKATVVVIFFLLINGLVFLQPDRAEAYKCFRTTGSVAKYFSAFAN